MIEPTEQADDDTQTFECWSCSKRVRLPQAVPGYRSYDAVRKIFKCCRRARHSCVIGMKCCSACVLFQFPKVQLTAELFDNLFGSTDADHRLSVEAAADAMVLFIKRGGLFAIATRKFTECRPPGVKRTWPIAVQMSAYDPKRTFNFALRMSAFEGKSGIKLRGRNGSSNF